MQQDRAARSSQHAAHEGAAFGDFRVAQRVASGAMATVYLGYRASARCFTQPVAIKVLHPHLAASPEFVRMFMCEARIGKLVEHDNACSVLDLGEAHGTFYMAMEFLLGETLADVLKTLQRRDRTVRIAPELVACIVAQACDGLYAAHAARDASGEPLRIVHRGVSPHKLHVGYDGRVRVLDFGAAGSPSTEHAHDGHVKGRFPYMSPEQIRGEAVDARTDVWSLGVVLRESASGRRLFRGNSAAAIVAAVVHEPLPAWPAHVPQALREVADRALQRNPGKRYADTGEMSRELRRFLSSASAPSQRALASWMRTLFADELQRKSALLDETERQSLALPLADLRLEKSEACEEPTRIALDDEPTTIRTPAFGADDDYESLRVGASSSHVRPVVGPPVTERAPPPPLANTERTPRGRIAKARAQPLQLLGLCLLLAVAGAVLGWLVVKATLVVVSAHMPSNLEAAPAESVHGGPERAAVAWAEPLTPLAREVLAPYVGPHELASRQRHARHRSQRGA